MRILSHLRSDFLAVTTGIVIFLILLAFIFFYSTEALNKDSMIKMQFALTQIEKVISNAEKVTESALPLTKDKCSIKLISQLQHLVMITPNVRSLSLNYDGRRYCSSEIDAPPKNKFQNSLTEPMLELQSGGGYPSPSALLFRQGTRATSSVAEIDSYFISNILSIVHSPSPIFFRVSNSIITESGDIIHSNNLPRGIKYTLNSSNYPVKIIYVVSPLLKWNYFWINYRFALLGCFLLSSIIVISLYRWHSSPMSPLDALKWGVKHQQFIPYIQPIVDANTNKVIGGEILLRWQHPTEGIIPPNQFIPLAEASGLVIPMTRQIISMLVNILTTDINKFPKPFHLSININLSHLQNKMLVVDILRLRNSFEMSEVNLILELTEREQPEITSESKSVFKILKESGVCFSLDDFGTGYSTHSYLQEFPVDYIKIDQSFVQMIGSDEISHHIVESVIELAQRLDIHTVAEGVENETQAEYLKKHGVKYLQGYLYGRPVMIGIFIASYL